MIDVEKIKEIGSFNISDSDSIYLETSIKKLRTLDKDGDTLINDKKKLQEEIEEYLLNLKTKKTVEINQTVNDLEKYLLELKKDFKDTIKDYGAKRVPKGSSVVIIIPKLDESIKRNDKGLGRYVNDALLFANLNDYYKWYFLQNTNYQDNEIKKIMMQMLSKKSLKSLDTIKSEIILTIKLKDYLQSLLLKIDLVYSLDWLNEGISNTCDNKDAEESRYTIKRTRVKDNVTKI